MTKEDYLKVITKWKHYWMSDIQNPKEENNNYFNRAFGIDANMKHHLAKLIVEAQTPDPSDPKKEGLE